jgi:hypothetical protein
MLSAALGQRKKFRRISDRAQAPLHQHLPAQMTVKMLLKPLNLPTRLLSALETPLARITEKLFLHQMF